MASRGRVNDRLNTLLRNGDGKPDVFNLPSTSYTVSSSCSRKTCLSFLTCSVPLVTTLYNTTNRDMEGCPLHPRTILARFNENHVIQV